MTSATNGNAAKVLDACRYSLGRISIDEILLRLPLTRKQVSDAFLILIGRGLATRARRGIYRLTPEGFAALVEPIEIKSGPLGPRVMELPETSIRTRVWRALRLTRRGSIRDLLVLASRNEIIDPGDIKKYLNALTKAGYLVRMARRGEAHGSRYLLIRDTGPQAPQWNKRQNRVFDPNTEGVHELG